MKVSEANKYIPSSTYCPIKNVKKKLDSMFFFQILFFSVYFFKKHGRKKYSNF